MNFHTFQRTKSQQSVNNEQFRKELIAWESATGGTNKHSLNLKGCGVPKKGYPCANMLSVSQHFNAFTDRQFVDNQ